MCWMPAALAFAYCRLALLDLSARIRRSFHSVAPGMRAGDVMDFELMKRAINDALYVEATPSTLDFER